MPTKVLSRRFAFFSLLLATVAANAVRGQAQESPFAPAKESAALAGNEPKAPAAGESSPAAEHPIETIEMPVRAAAVPRPVLKYRLLPTYLDRTAGNAAPIYSKVFLVLKDWPIDEKLIEWCEETPLDKLPINDVRKKLEPYVEILQQAEIAASRDRCDWDPPIRESENIFMIILPEAQGARNLARLLALRARVEMVEGKTDQASQTLRSLFALSRHTTQQPFLISGMVGIAIQRLATSRVEELIQAADAPNLYWALTDLPAPLVDLRTGLEIEYAALHLVFPEMRDLRNADFADDQWDRLFEQLAKRLEKIAWMIDDDDERKELIAAARQQGVVDGLYNDARSRLLERGEDRQSIDAMPKSRVVLLDIAESFEQARDEAFKALNLPYARAHKAFAEADEAIQQAKNRGPGGQLAAMLLPAMSAAKLAAAVGQRHLEALRTIEAIRLYAAEHGSLPEQLIDVAAVPLPENPVTGKPFGYRLKDGVATLDAAGPIRSRRYRIRLVK